MNRDVRVYIAEWILLIILLVVLVVLAVSIS